MKSGDPPGAVSPETELLLLCTRTSPSPADAERVRHIVQGHVDWEALTELSLRHHVAPLVHRNLAAFCREMAPAIPRRALGEHFASNAHRNLYLVRALLEVVGALEAAGVAVIPFKGPILAATAYGDLALRQAGDIDIIVSRDHIPTAESVLHAHGYKAAPLKAESASEQELRPRGYRDRLGSPAVPHWAHFSPCECSFIRDNDEVELDLHWNAAKWAFSLPLEFHHLQRFRRPVILGGTQVQTLAPEILLLVLSAHGAHHCWSRLRWICDIDALSVAPLDWPWVWREAQRLHVERMLALALYLAGDLLGTCYPADVRRRVLSDETVPTLARWVGRRLLSSEPSPSDPTLEDEIRFVRRMRERRRDRLRYLLRLATDPRPQDWLLIPLPQPLIPLYRVLRAVRLSAKYGLLALRRLTLAILARGTKPHPLGGGERSAGN